MEIPQRYDPKEAEPRWQDVWEERKLYESQPQEGAFTIDTPPPTMSGKMHIGHASSYSQQDCYARFWRMRTGKVFFPFGTDDNGLPTERLVEKLKGVKSTKMSRAEFRELCFKTIEELRPDFVADWKRIGISADYAHAYSTISKQCQAVSQASFIDLFHKDRVYQQESPVAWCVQCQTAIAQAEFDNIEKDSTFNDIAFHAGEKELIISTTRPELIPACVALAAHPDDPRYADLKGSFIQVPLCDYDVPIIYDETVAIDKGTGLMMVCTFGDKEDVEKWHKYDLPLRIIFTRDGKLNELAGKYATLSIKDARKQILADLEAAGLLKSQKPIRHAVNVHERCGTEIEFLKTRQWYVRVLDIKQELLEAGRKIEWHPEFMRTRYEHWVENLNWDWCISRQRYFGIPFPLWHDTKTGEVHVASADQLPVDPFVDRPAGLPKERWDDLVPEEDVMDTWATSSVTPQIVLDLHAHPDRSKLLPMSLRPQAHDIIRTWAFYTIVKAHLNNSSIPWKDIAISGFVTDPKGEKMSKSKGNVVVPQDVIEKYSADTIRYWAAGAKLGDDIPYMEKDLVTGHKTVNKIWNASRFAIMNLEGYDGSRPELQVVDRWILHKFAKLVERVTRSFETYDHSKAKFDVEQFFWNDLCDNYLELVKGRLYEPKDEDSRRAAQYTLATVLEGVLKLFAPFLPFITEEVYSYLPIKGKAESIHVSKWPETDASWIDEEAFAIGEDILAILAQVRKHKSEKQLSMRAPIPAIRIAGPNDVSLAKDDLLAVTSAAGIDYAKADALTLEIADQEDA